MGMLSGSVTDSSFPSCIHFLGEAFPNSMLKSHLLSHTQSMCLLLLELTSYPALLVGMWLQPVRAFYFLDHSGCFTDGYRNHLKSIRRSETSSKSAEQGGYFSYWVWLKVSGVAGSLIVTMWSLKTRVTRKKAGPRRIDCQSSVLGSSHACELFRTFIQPTPFTSFLSSSWSWNFCHLGKNIRIIFTSTEVMCNSLELKESWDFKLDSILSYHFSLVSISLHAKWI